MKKFHARGKKPGLPRAMTALERFYSEELERRLLAGEILYHRFEPARLRLADGSFYKPDFLVIDRDGFVEFHETKGHWREAARVRIRVAAEIFPFFRFIAIKAGRGGRIEQEIFDPFERSENSGRE